MGTASASYLVRPSSQYKIEDKPREALPIRRLQIDGADTLAVNELVQIALGKVDNFESIIQEYGIQFLTGLNTVEDIVDALHLDHLQATRLLAILALGKRLFGHSQGSLVQIRGIEDVYQYSRPMIHLAKEQLRVYLINSRYQLIHEETVAIGSTEYIHIAAKDIFQAAVERRVSAVILVHNHPSGDPTPSQSDYDFTASMIEAGKLLGIEVLDHVIIGLDSYASSLPVQEGKAGQHLSKAVDK
ncbi:hypothetical protein KGQ71_00805 [Patescibacteria group bacterium]|nr:hypothetical protein [Patescibacteria group bacterium]